MPRIESKRPEDMTLDELTIWRVMLAIKQHGGNKTHAAKSLGVSTQTVQRYAKRTATAPNCMSSDHRH